MKDIKHDSKKSALTKVAFIEKNAKVAEPKKEPTSNKDDDDFEDDSDNEDGSDDVSSDVPVAMVPFIKFFVMLIM